MTFDERVNRNVGENWQAIYSREAYEFAQRVWEALSQPAEQHQGEPLARYSVDQTGCEELNPDGPWVRYDDLNCDPGEVERLQFELSEARAIANGQTSLRKEEAEDWAKERDTLRAQLADLREGIESQLSMLRLTGPSNAASQVATMLFRHDTKFAALSASADPSFENKGIKNHDGRCKAAEQKLLVQHILDNDKGLSDSSSH